MPRYLQKEPDSTIMVVTLCKKVSKKNSTNGLALSSKLQRDSWGAEQGHLSNKAEGNQQFRHQHVVTVRKRVSHKNSINGFARLPKSLCSLEDRERDPSTFWVRIWTGA